MHYKSLQCDISPLDAVRRRFTRRRGAAFQRPSARSSVRQRVTHPNPTQPDPFSLQKSKDFKVIQQYIKSTARYGQLLDVFEIDRHNEDKRFAEHDVRCGRSRPRHLAGRA